MANQSWLADGLAKERYPSRTLDTSKGQIRILKLLPGQRGAELCYNLAVVCLRDHTRGTCPMENYCSEEKHRRHPRALR